MLRSAALCALPVILAFAPLNAASPSATSPSLVGTQQRTKHTQFRLEFDAAVKIGSNKRMDKLMKDMHSEAIFALIETSDAISHAPNDVLYDRFNALRATWYRLYDNDFPDQLELYFVNLTPAEKKARRKLKAKYDKLSKPRAAAIAAKDLPGLLAISDQYERVAEDFKTMGDRWFESDACVAAGDIADEFYHKKKTDYQRVATLYERAIELRDELGVKDLTYRQVLPRKNALVGLGFGSGAPDPSEVIESEENPAAKDETKDGGEELKPLAPAGEPVTIDMTYAELNGLKDLARPNYYLDENRQIWPTVGLGKMGDVKDIPRLGDISPKVMRIGDSKVGIDTDGDGESNLPWPTRGKLDVVSFEIGAGDAKRMWGLLVEVGRQQDFYQGITINLAQTTDNLTLYYMPGGKMVGEVGGVSLELFDDNLDGIYGSAPSNWAHRQLRPGTDQPEFDSIRIGGEKKARPMSEHVEIPGAGWHKVESLNGGNQLALTPVSFKTGTLQLKSKGIKPKFVILKGTGPKLSNTFVDISGGKKVKVPVGRWELHFGILSEGKKMQVNKAVILPSSASPSYDVKEGGNVVVQLGAPFAFDFEVTKQDDTVTVKGMSVQIIGSGGEAYDRFYGAVPQPDATVRKTGTKRGFATENMPPGRSQDDIAKHGWHQTWKPLDLIIPTKNQDVQVHLFEKKNKLFGKVESDWL